MGFVEKSPCRTNEIYSYLRLAISPVSCYTKGYAGIAALVEGMPIDEVVKRLENIKCGSRPTSCPDQLAKALKKVAEEQ